MVKLFFEQEISVSRLNFELFSSDSRGNVGINKAAANYFQFCPYPEQADWIFVPYLLSSLVDDKGKELIKKYAYAAKKYGKPLVIVSDSDLVYNPGIADIVILTPGPFASLGNQFAIPAILPEDPIRKFYDGKWSPLTDFSSFSIGFCGQATQNVLKTVKDALTIVRLRLQIKRKQSPYLHIPFFLAAYERAKLLRFVQKKSEFRTDFVIRKKYKAGANTVEKMSQVEKEFFENISNNLFTICLRGFGNYSVRFFQTLAMGRIPILVDTDNVLPFESTLDYEKVIVRVPFADRYNFDNYVKNFLKGKTVEELIAIQYSARELWLNSLTQEGTFRGISDELTQLAKNKYDSSKNYE